MLQEGWNSKLLMLFITITSLFVIFFVLLQNMKIEDIYKKEINDLIIRRGSTKFHITGIRHCDFKDKADDFIRDAAQKMQNVILQLEEANLHDPEAVVCRSGNNKIGYVSVYDLEKYHILARKEDSDHLTGHFFSGNTGDHLLDLSVAGIITMDDIRNYRKEVDRQKNEQYGLWKCNAIKRYLVHSRHQDDAKACIIQMKEFVAGLFGGYGSTTQDELSPLLEQYKESSQYDISLEGQRDRWDILRYLDYLYDRWHMPGSIMDKYFEDILTDVSSQIGGELGRSASYKAYIERLTKLVATDLPSSETAHHYLKTLPDKAFDDIRQQVESFPYHLYHMFHNDPDEFVRTIYYARIPRKYLDPFLSGIALLEAYDNKPKKWHVPDAETLELRDLGDKLEEWYEDYCEKIVQYPIERQLTALRNMRKQVLASVNFIEGSPRMGDDPEDVHYVKFIGPKRDFPARLRYFGSNFVERVREGEMAWEEYIPENIAHKMTFVEFAYIFFIGALKYEIDRLENLKSYDEPNEGDNVIVHFSKHVTNEELTAIYDDLMEHELLCNNPPLSDFIYWHTGEGTRPAEPLMWKQKNVCHYYVQIYLNSKWTIAEQCFSCKKGSISGLDSSTNITKTNKEIINKILEEARLKSTKIKTKND